MIHEVCSHGCPTCGFMLLEIPRIGTVACNWDANADEIRDAIWRQRRKRVAATGGPLPMASVYVEA